MIDQRCRQQLCGVYVSAVSVVVQNLRAEVDAMREEVVMQTVRLRELIARGLRAMAATTTKGHHR
jgi:hypothetical protein